MVELGGPSGVAAECRRNSNLVGQDPTGDPFQRAVEIPRGGAGFCEHSCAKSSFSVGIHNAIEETTPYVVKVTCFAVELVVPAGPPRKRQHYRGFCHLGRWGP
jgi:hypothetical protein